VLSKVIYCGITAIQAYLINLSLKFTSVSLYLCGPRYLLASVWPFYTYRVFYYHMGPFHLVSPTPVPGRRVWGWTAPAL